MCAIRRVNEAHSKLQLNRFCSKKIYIFFGKMNSTTNEGNPEQEPRLTLANLTLEWVVQDILLCRAQKMAVAVHFGP